MSEQVSEPTDDVSAVHRAARVEDAVHEVLEGWLRKRGWSATVVPYTGYGAPGWVRVMGRVMVSRPDRRRQRKPGKVRGWRSFTTVSAKDAPFAVEVGGRRHELVADRGGFIDTVLEADLEPGWRHVLVSSGDGEPVEAPVRIVDPAARFGVVSDIDDTVMVTALPRPLLAAWNTFVLDEHARAAVPGMAVLYERLTTAHPAAPIFYLSTGAWNVAPALTRFLSRHLYPLGPLLLTDWGPQRDRIFRSGKAHKLAALRRLTQEIPWVKWLLVGDDGQHDPEIYRTFAESHPDHVAAVAIRTLSPTQTVLAGHLPSAAERPPTASDQAGNRWVSAPDGAGLWSMLSVSGVLD
ncbi:App1 family protein [Phytohabitans kaempferiae]|uniref:App1 family protein n=1 Tax=Phytohabitans kaempferiae TaxID=1620943 RepID=A0ABV6MG49_9ACTN